ncbi:MAG: hypothetical protein EOO99_08395 [Pedobacter sp.]|nr:MAG: hypothetical protein EOO99_08395 [Pedobacter sp.]
MKQTFLYFLFASALISFASCAGESNKTSSTVPPDSLFLQEDTALTNSSDITGVYYYQANGDSVRLHILQTSPQVSGDLIFALREKDRNTGTFTGQLENDILVADYTFQSEGMESVRQIAFKITATSAIPLYGDVEEKDGKIFFKSLKTLHPDPNMILKKAN